MGFPGNVDAVKLVRTTMYSGGDVPRASHGVRVHSSGACSLAKEAIKMSIRGPEANLVQCSQVGEGSGLGS